MARTLSPIEATKAARRIAGRKVDNIRIAELTRQFNDAHGWEIVRKVSYYSGRPFWQIVDREGNVKHSPFWDRRDAEATMIGIIERHAAGLEVG